jgi:hypothetical protein
MEQDFFNDPTNRHKFFKGIISYMAYFGSRFVGNDIQLLCGNVLDHPVAKTFTLFCIMYQATDSFDMAVAMTLFFLIVQYAMSISPACNKYVDKTTAKKVNIHSVTWPINNELDSLGLKPEYSLSRGEARKRGIQD